MIVIFRRRLGALTARLDLGSAVHVDLAVKFHQEHELSGLPENERAELPGVSSPSSTRSARTPSNAFELTGLEVTRLE